MPGEHLLEYAQMLNVLEGHSSQQGVVIRGVLIKNIVSHQDHLHFVHVILLIHLESASVHDLLQSGLGRTRIEAVLHDVVVDLVGELVALLEALVVGADEHNPQVQLLEADVHVEHVLLSAPWDANGRPRLSIGHRAERHHKVEDHSNI